MVLYTSVPLISVIVPVYNAAKTIRQCIESILLQTFPDFELLLIDDGSKDTSDKICDEYAAIDSRVRVFHKENGGASSARNFGIDKAQGTWVTFCDSDDWVYSTWLQNFKDNMEDVDLVCQGIECTSPMCGEENNNKTYVYGVNYCGSIEGGMYELIKKRIVGYTVVKCFKKDLIDNYKLRFNTSFTIQEDEEFILRYIMFCNKMKSINLVGYYYETPNYAIKYTDQIKQYIVNKQLYRIVKYRKGDKWEYIKRYYEWFYVYEFIRMFEKEKKKCLLLMDFRRTIGHDIMKSNLFFFTKWLIYLDFTGQISTFVLDLHLKIKNRISHK